MGLKKDLKRSRRQNKVLRSNVEYLTAELNKQRAKETQLRTDYSKFVTTSDEKIAELFVKNQRLMLVKEDLERRVNRLKYGELTPQESTDTPEEKQLGKARLEIEDLRETLTYTKDLLRGRLDQVSSLRAENQELKQVVKDLEGDFQKSINDILGAIDFRISKNSDSALQSPWRDGYVTGLRSIRMVVGSKSPQKR